MSILPSPQKTLLQPPTDDASPQTDDTLLPPPYESDTEDEEPTTTLTLNAPTTIHGSSNLISLPPLDTARISALLLAALNAKARLGGARGIGSVNVAINCGVNVVGDRNVIARGWVGGRVRGAGNGSGNGNGGDTTSNPTEEEARMEGSAWAGAERKRKADAAEIDGAPEAKRSGGVGANGA